MVLDQSFYSMIHDINDVFNEAVDRAVVEWSATREEALIEAADEVARLLSD